MANFRTRVRELLACGALSVTGDRVGKAQTIKIPLFVAVCESGMSLGTSS